jgi:hypothetical protein
LVLATLSQKLPIAVSDALFKGVERCGDFGYAIKTKEDLEPWRGTKTLNCISQYGPWNGGQEKIRGIVHNYSELYKVRKLCIDIGLVKNYRLDPNNLAAYSTIGFDDFKGYGNYYSSNHSGERWNSFNLEIKPWRKDGEHILIVGQPAHGFSASKFDIENWYPAIVSKLRELTDRPLFFRQHPLQKQLPNLPGVKMIGTYDQPLEKDFENCWAVISKTSSMTISALLNGIPVICDDDLNPGCDLAEKNVASINSPVMPTREQFFYDLAYTQWNLKEIEKGEPWRRLRDYIYV